jgi:NADPH:quinone reductase-like Zn-dependent oxidoreductase
MKLRYKIGSGLLVLLLLAVISLSVAISYSADCGPAPSVAAGSETMKAVTYRCYGSPEVLEFGDIEKPVPADDEVLVRIQAAAVNPLDWHYMRGSPYLMRLMSGLGAPKDSSFGVDFSGTVEAIGQDVRSFRPGDEVFGGKSGAYAEYIAISEDRQIVHKPESVTAQEAAAVPIAALTALQALRDKGQIQPGQKVLINGASGGVGTFAVQIAKSFGAEVTGVCSTRNVELVRSLGADHVIDYKKESYIESGNTWDLIIDNVGNHSLLANRKVLAPDGRFVSVGAPSGNWLGPLARPLMTTILSPFVDQEFITLMARMRKDDLATLAQLMEAGEMRSVIDRTWPLEQVAEAIRYSESGRARGKIIITVE